MADPTLDYARPRQRAAIPWRMILAVALGIVLGIGACVLLTMIYLHTGGLAPE